LDWIFNFDNLENGVKGESDSGALSIRLDELGGLFRKSEMRRRRQQEVDGRTEGKR